MTDCTLSETKSAEAAAALAELNHAFESFTDANESRLAEIETRLAGDVLHEEKLARIDAALDEAKRRLDRMALDARRPPLAGAPAPRDAAGAEHKAAFDAYVRSGEAAGLKSLEAKSLSVGSGSYGVFLVPVCV